MGHVVRAHLDFQNLNRQRISILMHDVSRGKELKEYFLAQGFQVDMVSEPSRLYAVLCDGESPPGFVMISNQIQGTMARSMPDFIVNRFHAPVFLFQENPDLPAPKDSLEALRPEIVPLGLVDPAQVLGAFTGFDELYQNRVSGSGKTRRASESVFQQLKSEVISREIELRDDDVLTIHTCKIADPAGRGFFVFGFPARTGGDVPVEASLLLETRIIEAAGEGAQMQNLTQGVTGVFFKQLLARSDEVVTGMVGDREMFLCYFRNHDEVVEPDAKILEAQCLVPMEEWWSRLPLPCHTYIWLERNQRRILYVRPGQNMRPEGFERLSRKGVGHLSIDPDDFAEYRKIREIVHVAGFEIIEDEAKDQVAA